MKAKIKEKIQKLIKKRICKNCEFYEFDKNECHHINNEQIKHENKQMVYMHPMQVYQTFGCNNFQKDKE